MNFIFYIAQGLSLISCLFIWISCVQKTTQKILIFQSIETTLGIIATVLLGGWTGALTLIVALIRNITGIFNKTTKITTITCLCGVIILGATKVHSFIDILPIIASAEYTIVLLQNNVKATKIALAINATLWLIYYIPLQGWVYIGKELITIILCIIALIQLMKIQTNTERINK